MINVIIYKKTSNTFGFKISGHAEYADPGSDIVCSAVSALAITTFNSLEELCYDDFHFEANQKNGDMELWFNEEPSHNASVIMQVFEIGITNISESYSDFICITFKEV